jgi:hypothetical protein
VLFVHLYLFLFIPLQKKIGNVGKTSLLKSLIRTTTKQKSKDEGPNVATDGIDIAEVGVKL